MLTLNICVKFIFCSISKTYDLLYTYSGKYFPSLKYPSFLGIVVQAYILSTHHNGLGKLSHISGYSSYRIIWNKTFVLQQLLHFICQKGYLPVLWFKCKMHLRLMCLSWSWWQTVCGGYGTFRKQSLAGFKSIWGFITLLLSVLLSLIYYSYVKCNDLATSCSP